MTLALLSDAVVADHDLHRIVSDGNGGRNQHVDLRVGGEQNVGVADQRGRRRP